MAIDGSFDDSLIDDALRSFRAVKRRVRLK
jgi:hypothetical protein